MARALLVLLAALLALVSAPAATLADGDPASDVLPTEDAYYPYTPQPPAVLVEALDRLLADVRAAGYPMKVAIVATASDLGAYPDLFNDPQRYANQLAATLPSNPHGGAEIGRVPLHLLVVMPGGFGGKGLGARVDEALAPVEIDAASGADGLIKAALQAVARIATVNGFPTEVPAATTAPLPDEEKEEGGIPRATGLVVVGVIALLLLVGLLVARRRARASDARPPEEPSAQAQGEEIRSP